ncbi:hypothetical protein F7725_011730 [Dissostichus mawsoni]|uniref:Uncharacterized protein n=1 Tax=Dissostichus mawsoni TaxID=36200 RepID=A0A7J5ZBS5_DISMA|nr:hypothetical protein F7725_011730 [Dissostichus mawsoni]
MAKPPSTAFASAPVHTSRSELLSEPPPTASVSNLQLLPSTCRFLQPPEDDHSPEDPHRKLWSNLHLQPL